MKIARCVGYLGSTLGLLLSSILLAFLWSHHYHQIRTLTFPLGTCTVASSFYVIQYRCHCGSDCKALYPCLEIEVFLNDTLKMSIMSQEHEEKFHGGGSGDTGYHKYQNILWLDEDYNGPWPVPLYVDDHQYLTVVHSKEDTVEQCSLVRCSSNDNDNRDYIDIFRRKHAVRGQKHQCYYDPRNKRLGAFIHRRIRWWMAIHVILWPCLFMLGSIAMFFLVFYTRRKASGKYDVSSRWPNMRERRLPRQDGIDDVVEVIHIDGLTGQSSSDDAL